MNNEFSKIVNECVKLYEEAYEIYNIEVQKLIINKVKDINLIENTLDHIMDIYTEKGFYLFIKLLIYYSTVNYSRARDYLEILKEQREEEYHDFIKKIKI